MKKSWLKETADKNHEQFLKLPEWLQINALLEIKHRREKAKLIYA